MSFDLIHEMARRLGHDTARTREQVDVLVDELHAEIDAQGHARVPGLGTLRRQDEGLVFEPDAELANAVNYRYTGLEQMDVDAPGSAKPYSTERLVGEERSQPEDPPREEKPPQPEEPSPSEEPPLPEGKAPPPPPEEEVEEEEEEEAYWSATDEGTEEHPLGPMSNAPYEEADYSVVDEDPDASPPPDGGAKEPTVQWKPHAEVESQESEWAPPTDIPDEEEAEAVEPEPEEEPAEMRRKDDGAPPPAPPPAGRRVQRGPNRFQQEQERSYGPWIVGGLFVVALLAVGVWWIIESTQETTPDQRVATLETAPPDTAQADTPAADTLVASSPAAAAPPPDTPLRSNAGLLAEEGGYTVVVASERSESAAEDVARQYADEGYRAGLVVGSSGGVTRFRVGVGQFETIDRAEAVRDSMRGGAIPQDAWVTRIR